MKKNDFILAIASALEVDKELIKMDLKMDDIPEWDSLGHLTILTHLDDMTDGKAGEISNLGSLDKLEDIWNEFVKAGLAEES
jgi:hypothetical protein